MKKEFRSVCLITVLFLLQKALVAQQVGVFDNHNDVGAVQHAGSATYDSLAQQYTVSGSGANIWGVNDQFHFLWKRMSGDFILQARGAFIGKGVDPHRKWGWMIRNSLDSSAAMASVHIHGDGLVAFQYRKESGSNIEEKRSAITAPDVIQLERRGNTYIMSVARFGDPFTKTQLL
jgi:hypothetical protein